MVHKEDYLQRLGEIELERPTLLEQMDHVQERLIALDKEYVALKNLLTTFAPDRRWVSHSASLLEAVYYILKEAGKPLHYKEIYRRLRSQLVHIAGSASLSNLVVRLNRDARFIKTDRGIYGLTEWSLAKNSSFKSGKSLISFQRGGNKGRTEVLAVPEERNRERIKFILESMEVDIQITQSNLKALRDKLLGRDSEFALPEGVDPAIAFPTLERRLAKLLEQRDQLKLQLKEAEEVGADRSSSSAHWKADRMEAKGY